MARRKVKNKKWKSPKVTFKIFSFFLFALYVQLVYLSVSKEVYGKNMSEFAASRNTVKQSIKAERGTIYDRNKEELALNVSSYTLIAYLDPKRSEKSSVLHHVKDINKTAEALSTVLDEDKDYFKEKLENGKKNNRKQIEFGTVGKGISELTKEKIESLNLPGIDFIETKKRYYPNGNFASYIIGYAREKEITYKEEDGDRVTKNEITGELGIEAEYNDLLKGEDGYLEYQQDRYGYKIADTKEVSEPAKNGYNIYLTIDSNVQRFVESAIVASTEEYSPELMMLTVMNAKTGDILATSQTPSFDPNLRDIENYENSFVSYTYEPGSTMKIYTYMCAIENGVYNGDETFESGSYKIGDDTIKDWNNKGWGTITYDKGFEYSSNVGIANLINKKLSKDKLKECYKKFGFGNVTGVELSREMSGSINFKYPIEVATAGFGQGISSTAIQQLQALTIIANDGKMIKPHIVDKIVDPNTKKIYYESKKEESSQLVKQETVNKIKDLMYNVVNGVDGYTTGKAYKIEEFNIIGKTGTAEISENGKYLNEQYIYSFAGMYPKDNPEYIIYGMIKKPKYNTSKGLSDAVKNVILSMSKYKEVEVDEPIKETKKDFTLTSYIGKNTEDVINKLKENNINVIKIGEGNKIINQYPKENTIVTKKDKVILFTNKNNKIPSLIGLSRTEVKVVLNYLNIRYKLEGYGYAYEQSIEANKEINNEKITVKFKSTKLEEKGEEDE